MKDQLNEEQNQAILKALNEALEQGPWQESNFLKAIGKKLGAVRDAFSDFVNQSQQPDLHKDRTMKADQRAGSPSKEVYVSLYSSDGMNLSSWEKIIANLPTQMISRPIYAAEDHVKAFLRAKENKNNEAYLVISIYEVDILTLSQDKTLRDKSGNPLLNLKANALNLERATRFVHLNEVYQYYRGHLIKST